jgi:glycosyltransferase involved in cell wall biosynthesis
MACGRPVISCDYGGPKEIVTEKTGFLVKPKSSAELVNLISNLGSYDLESMGKASRKRIETNFTCDNTVKSLLKIFKNG